MTQPLLYIEPPDLEPYRYGLFGAPQPRTLNREDGTTDPHWQWGGVEFESLADYQGEQYPTGYLYCDAGGGDKTLSDYAGTTKATAFTVYGGVDCSSIGRPQADYEARARAIVELAGQNAAENALWSGPTGNVPTLNGADTTDLTPGTVPSLHAGVGILEAYMASHYNGKSLIHATRDVAAFAAAENQIIREFLPADEDGARVDWLTTVLGTRWVFGGGYDGTGPNAADPTDGEAWLYATGQLLIVRDDITVPANFPAALDRVNNIELLLAEQTYLIAVDGPIVACQVTLT